MGEYKYIYGPVPSRRLGISLGISPVEKKSCNYSCIYCQLGRTNCMLNNRKEFFPVEDIFDELDGFLVNGVELDVVTIVGEGEPTLYSDLGQLIAGIKKRTDKPIVVITNGALLSEEEVREDLKGADIVLPSLDAYDEESFRKINRPHGKIEFEKSYEGLVQFSKTYKGNLWLETMLIKGINDDVQSLLKLKELMGEINYQRLYINVPVRPPAENDVAQPTEENIKNAINILGGVAIDSLVSKGFYSDIEDDYKAVLSIIGRHPMNQHEISGFLEIRKCKKQEGIFKELVQDDNVEIISYKGYNTYRLV
ncbi:MAG: radical SAM protein [Clostridia bacterium]|nr:radical SAM protein [Clostridia bacterium]